MDNRLIFLYHQKTFEQWGDAGRQGIALMDMRVQAARFVVRQIPPL
jgi:hypothetical protein